MTPEIIFLCKRIDALEANSVRQGDMIRALSNPHLRNEAITLLEIARDVQRGLDAGKADEQGMVRVYYGKTAEQNSLSGRLRISRQTISSHLKVGVRATLFTIREEDIGSKIRILCGFALGIDNFDRFVKRMANAFIDRAKLGRPEWPACPLCGPDVPQTRHVGWTCDRCGLEHDKSKMAYSPDFPDGNIEQPDERVSNPGRTLGALLTLGGLHNDSDQTRYNHYTGTDLVPIRLNHLTGDDTTVQPIDRTCVDCIPQLDASGQLPCNTCPSRIVA